MNALFRYFSVWCCLELSSHLGPSFILLSCKDCSFVIVFTLLLWFLLCWYGYRLLEQYDLSSASISFFYWRLFTTFFLPWRVFVFLLSNVLVDLCELVCFEGVCRLPILYLSQLCDLARYTELLHCAATQNTRTRFEW